MMLRLRFLTLCFWVSVALFSSCTNTRSDKTKVVIYTKAPIGALLSIKNIRFGDEQAFTADSAIIKNNHDSLVLFIPKDYDRLFRVTLSESRLQIIIANDTRLLRIHVDYFANQYSVEGSKTTLSLMNLQDRRVGIIGERNRLIKKLDSLNKANIKGTKIDTVKSLLVSTIGDLKNNDIAYADTVSNPAAFLEINSLIDFENDYEGYKKYILRAEARYPDYALLKQLKADAIATAKIFEEEYLVGDKLPYISLPNNYGLPYSTSSLEGQYYLIDFWSTMCRQCLVFTNAERKLIKRNEALNLTIVSVALDDQDDLWQKVIVKNHVNWIQLIDRKMWEGTAARTLKFDSIPFNFLVSPQGKILAKAIKPDSLEKVVARLKPN